MTRFILTLAAFTALTPTFAHAEMTAAQKQEMESVIHEYILNHGELLIESVNKYQAKQEEEANKASEEKAAIFLKDLKTSKDLAFAGNENGDITVVEFFDYNCGYCKKAFDEIKSLLNDDKNVKVVFYDFPILGPASLEMAKWGHAAKLQGKYFEYHSALMLHNGEKDEAVFKKLGDDIGLDTEKLAKDAKDPEVEKSIRSHVQIAQDLGFSGTPGFLINEKIFRGYIPYDVMKETIKELRAKTKEGEKK